MHGSYVKLIINLKKEARSFPDLSISHSSALQASKLFFFFYVPEFQNQCLKPILFFPTFLFVQNYTTTRIKRLTRKKYGKPACNKIKRSDR